MLRIISVEALEDFMLKISFDNGNTLILNMEIKIDTVRFRQLQDKELFQKVSTDGFCIHWNDLIEIDSSEAFEIAKSQAVEKVRAYTDYYKKR